MKSQHTSPLEGVAAEFPALVSLDAKEGKPSATPRFFEDSIELNKGETKSAWAEFGGDKLAVFNNYGSACITRIIERFSRKQGVIVRFTERLTRKEDGYGFIEWSLVLKAKPKRLPPKHKFDPTWQPAILSAVRSIAVEGITVNQASQVLGEELNINHRSARAHLWAASKWVTGEASTFLPHSSMIRPIFELLCELGKKEQALSALREHCLLVPKPSAVVQEVLNEFGSE